MSREHQAILKLIEIFSLRYFLYKVPSYFPNITDYIPISPPPPPTHLYLYAFMPLYSTEKDLSFKLKISSVGRTFLLHWMEKRVIEDIIGGGGGGGGGVLVLARILDLLACRDNWMHFHLDQRGSPQVYQCTLVQCLFL